MDAPKFTRPRCHSRIMRYGGERICIYVNRIYIHVLLSHLHALAVMADKVFPTRVECAKILSYCVLNEPMSINKLLSTDRFAGQHQTLLKQARMQLGSSSAVLKLSHFPDCPIFSGRAAAGNGYVQFKNVASVYKPAVYLHRAAACFRAYEEYPDIKTPVDLEKWVGTKEASHLMVLPKYHSKRNFNPRLVVFEHDMFNKSRHFCM